MAVFEQNILWFQVPIDYILGMEEFERENDLCDIELRDIFLEIPVMDDTFL